MKTTIISGFPGVGNWNELNYGPYGKPLFMAVANKYGWPLGDDI